MENVNDLTIFIVDDIPDNIKVLKSLLEKHNYIVKGITSGQNALRAVQVISPDLILLDIKMPGMDGFEVCKKLKEDPSLRDIPVIFITALADTDSKLRAFDIGGADYITKPFHDEEVLARVQTQLKIALYSKKLKEHNISLIEKIHKKDEEKIAAQVLLDAAFEQSYVGMGFMDKEFKIISINKCFAHILGSENPKELVGLNPFEFTFKDDIQKQQEMFQKLTNDEISSFSMEKRDYKKDGTLTWLNIFVSKISNPTTHEISYIVIAEDINEKKALEEQFQINEDIMVNQSKHASMGELIGMIAHQWKQPISVISMAANNIKVDIEMDTVDNNRTNEVIDDIMRMVDHLSNTIDDFKNFFKPDKKKEYVAIESVLNKAIQIIGKSLENNGIELEVSNLSTTKPLIYPSELAHVFINIINNGKDAIVARKVDNGKIIITIEEDDNFITSTICDNAGGIPQEIMEKIGIRYFTTKKTKGTGLGLYMSKTIIEHRMHGEINWRNSEDGACFCIKLPK